SLRRPWGLAARVPRPAEERDERPRQRTEALRLDEAVPGEVGARHRGLTHVHRDVVRELGREVLEPVRREVAAHRTGVGKLARQPQAWRLDRSSGEHDDPRVLLEHATVEIAVADATRAEAVARLL